MYEELKGFFVKYISEKISIWIIRRIQNIPEITVWILP